MSESREKNEEQSKALSEYLEKYNSVSSALIHKTEEATKLLTESHHL